jgi:uncharacterized protein YchJ
VTSPNCGALAINERLNAQADTVNALGLSFGEHSIRDLARRGFESNFGAWRDLEGLAQRVKDAAKLRGIEQAWSSASEVDAVHSLRKIRPKALGGNGSGYDLLR